MSQPPTPRSPGQPLPQPQPQPWPLQGVQLTSDRRVDPDGPATDAASPPTDSGSPGWTQPPWSPDAADGGSPGWTQPPWSPDAADTRPFWRRIPAGWLIAGALVLVSAVAGWYFDEATPVNPATPLNPATQPDTSRSATDERTLGGNPHAYKLRVVDLRVGDCFDVKDPSADEIEDVKTVPCTTKHEFEVFYAAAMGNGNYPTGDAFGRYVEQKCTLAFGAYIGREYYDSDLVIYWLAPTDDAWRSGDRTVQCAAFHPRIAGLARDSTGPVIDQMTRSLRGTQQ